MISLPAIMKVAEPASWPPRTRRLTALRELTLLVIILVIIAVMSALSPFFFTMARKFAIVKK